MASGLKLPPPRSRDWARYGFRGAATLLTDPVGNMTMQRGKLSQPLARALRAGSIQAVQDAIARVYPRLGTNPFTPRGCSASDRGGVQVRGWAARRDLTSRPSVCEKAKSASRLTRLLVGHHDVDGSCAATNVYEFGGPAGV